MTIPKAVIFDLGKVLLDFDYRIASRKLSLQSEKTEKDFTDLLLHTSLLLDYETGQLTTKAFFERLCAETGYRGDLDTFSLAFSDIFSPIEPMIELQQELRRRGHRTFIFSNTNELAIEHVRKEYPFFSGFEGYILSYEHRCMKPDPCLYEAVEKESGCSGPELLYMDDRLENIVAGTNRNWRTIHHLDIQQTRSQVKELGLLS